MTGLHDVAAGDLGGTMKCGTTKSDDGDLAVCGWADHGSLALAMFPGRTDAEAAPTLIRQIRNAAQTRNQPDPQINTPSNRNGRAPA